MMNKPRIKEELDLAIDTLAFGGRGVARLRGYVIFVDGAVPGDRVKAVVTKAKSSFAEARAVDILNPSADRIRPLCRHFGICGGCSWQNLAYDRQLEFKQRQLEECFQHIGGISGGFAIDSPLPAEPLWRYRNKVEFSFAGGDQGRIDLGFHLPGDWRRILNIEDCLLHSEATNGIRNFIGGFAGSSGAAAYDQRSDTGFWRHVVIRESARTGEVMVNLVTGPGRFPGREEFIREITAAFPQIASLVWSINETKASVASGFPFEVLAGRDHIYEEICGVRLKVSPSAFMQTNSVMAERLYQKALAYAAPQEDERAFDLYCGMGSITLLLAQKCREVLGVEISEDAIDLAWENAAANGAANVTFQAGKVRSTLKNLDYRHKPDLVVLDPPRAGASKKEVQRLIETGAGRIIYVSCNAATMAGNAAQLTEAGYRLTRLGAVDMFPHTPHVEAVAEFKLD